MEITRVDKRGRILIPKRLREKANVKEGGYVRVRAEGKSIIIEPFESLADRYFGAFKTTRWPEDLDKLLVEVINRWWSQRAT